jgi:flagellar biosynthesis protein
MVDKYDNGGGNVPDDPLNPLNFKKKPARLTAVAITDAKPGAGAKDALPQVTAAGRGKIAEQILALAFANGIKVREDSALAEMLAALEIDSPVPNEALVAVAEIMSYIYRANGAPNPYDAILNDDSEEQS